MSWAYWSKKKAGSSSLYDTAIYVFSPRLLVSSYTGPCARVRRSSDNAEQDINFISGVIDEASIISFCGASNGFLNYYNQGTDSSNYPISFNTQIYDGTSILKVNGIPSIYFNNTFTLWRPNVTSTSDYLMDKPCMVFAPCLENGASSFYCVFGESLNNGLSIGVQISTASDSRDLEYRPDNTSRVLTFDTNPVQNQLYLFGYTKNNSGTVNGYLDGVKQTNELTGLSGVGFTTTGTSSLKWGAGRSATFSPWFLVGYSPEYIAFDYYDASLEASVQSDMKTYYGI